MRKKAAKKPKTVTVTSLKREIRKVRHAIDKQYSLYVRVRDHATCVVCGSRERPQCGHVFTADSLETRWDVGTDGVNAYCQCAACNCQHEYRPHLYHAWFIGRFGYSKFLALAVRHRLGSSRFPKDKAGYQRMLNWMLSKQEEIEAAFTEECKKVAAEAKGDEPLAPRWPTLKQTNPEVMP